MSLDDATMFTESAKIFKKFSKNDGKVCEHDFHHSGAAYNKSFIRLCSYGIVDVHLYDFIQIVVYLTTPKVLKSVQVLLTSGRWS